MRYETRPGDTINHTAAEMVRLVGEGEYVEADFNGIAITAETGTTAEAIVAAYWQASEARSAAYRASPEGQAAARKQEERRAAAQREADRLLAALPPHVHIGGRHGTPRTGWKKLGIWPRGITRSESRLDFNDLAAVLAWCEAMTDPSDHTGVAFSRQAVVETFEAHGYMAGVNCGPDFREHDRDNHGRWIVGQALSCLRTVGAIHGVLPRFAREWREKFAGAATEP